MSSFSRERTLFTEQEHVQTVLRQILEEHDGLTVEQIYSSIRQCRGDPTVQHYQSLESPHTPFTLQDIITVSLLQMGYEAEVHGARNVFTDRQRERLEQTCPAFARACP